MQLFASDKDLAVLDPAVFRELAWVGQMLSKGECTVSGTLLSASAADVEFTNAPITSGSVVVVNGAVLEVTSVVSDDTLAVSAVRPSGTTSVIVPVNVGGGAFAVATFRPQIAAVHRQLLAGLELRASTDPVDERLSETSIANAAELARLEALGALHLVCMMGGSMQAADHPANRRAALYRAMFLEERARVTVRIDVDGDGDVDVLRRLGSGVATMDRA